MSDVEDISLQADVTPVHHIVHHQRPERARGEGDDNGAEGTIVPQPADPPGRLQGFRGK